MTYEQTLDWMLNQLPFYQKQGGVAFKPGLDKIAAFCEYLGNPHLQLKNCIHVAGTNGKGSTVHLMASVLQEKGFKVGLYTSPHLLDFRERIKCNGVLVNKPFVTAFIQQHRDYIEDQQLTFFEISFAMALVYFCEQKIDYALVEVGMGGRLDATNMIQPILAVITNIGLDHTQYLGETHAEIAGEKAGIIKAHTPVVIGEYRNDTKLVFERVANEKKAPIYFVNPMSLKEYDFLYTDKNSYQQKNRQTAYTALKLIPGVVIEDEAVEKGFDKVVQNTTFMGRWQQIESSPKVIVDVSHNSEGFAHFLGNLQFEKYKNLHLVMGFVKDKNLDTIFQYLPRSAHYYFCAPQLFRALAVEDLLPQLPDTISDYRSFKTVIAAFEAAKAQADQDDLIVITGSTFVVAEVLEKIKSF